MPVAPRELGLGRREAARDGAVAAPDDLVEEALEEDGVARLIGLLVARKYFCSSRGAASMYGERVSTTASSRWKKSA